MNKNSKQLKALNRKNGNYFHGKAAYTFFDGREKHNPENKRKSAYKAGRRSGLMSREES